MDNIVVWLVIWGVLVFASAPIGAFLGALVGGVFDEPEIGGLIGWVIGGAFAVFAIIQTILQIISLVQYLN